MDSGNITSLLQAWGAQDPQASDQLFELVVDDLRRMARSHLRREHAAQTLQPTELVHEVYLRIAGASASTDWHNRRHFFGACAQIMRRLLVDRARYRRAEKRGSGISDLPLDEGLESLAAGHGQDRAGASSPVDLVALDNALGHLAERHPRACRVVELRYFLGLSIQETARALDSAERTVKLDWTQARARHFRELEGSGS